MAVVVGQITPASSRKGIPSLESALEIIASEGIETRLSPIDILIG